MTLLLPSAVLLQLMWGYASARCLNRHLLHLASQRATALAEMQAFSSSRQPSTLLWAFRSFGMFMHGANTALFAELHRLKDLEQQQQEEGKQEQLQQQQEEEGHTHCAL
jgi:hypothetical protein